MKRLLPLLILLALYITAPADFAGGGINEYRLTHEADEGGLLCVLADLEAEYIFEYENYDVDYICIMLALAWRESKFRENLITPENGGADYSVGFFQVRVDTAQWFLRRWRDSKGKIMIALLGAELNAIIASDYLLSKLRKYKSIDLALAAYNTGKPKYTSYGDLVNKKYVDDILLIYKGFLASKK